jgi:hypothetical protein
MFAGGQLPGFDAEVISVTGAKPYFSIVLYFILSKSVADQPLCHAALLHAHLLKLRRQQPLRPDVRISIDLRNKSGVHRYRSFLHKIIFTFLVYVG